MKTHSPHTRSQLHTRPQGLLLPQSSAGGLAWTFLFMTLLLGTLATLADPQNGSGPDGEAASCGKWHESSCGGWTWEDFGICSKPGAVESPVEGDNNTTAPCPHCPGSSTDVTNSPVDTSGIDAEQWLFSRDFSGFLATNQISSPSIADFEAFQQQYYDAQYQEFLLQNNYSVATPEAWEEFKQAAEIIDLDTDQIVGGSASIANGLDPMLAVRMSLGSNDWNTQDYNQLVVDLKPTFAANPIPITPTMLKWKLESGNGYSLTDSYSDAESDYFQYAVYGVNTTVSGRYDRAAHTLTLRIGGSTWPWQDNTPQNYVYSVLELTFSGGNGSDVVVDGTYLGQPYHCEISHADQMGLGAISSVQENGVKRFISEVFEEDVTDFDGLRLLRDIEDYKFNPATQQWVKTGHRQKRIRTLANGVDKVVEDTFYTAVGSEPRTTKYFYDERAVLGTGTSLLFNPSFGRLIGKDLPDGKWERYDFDAEGRLARRFSPWQDSPAPSDLWQPTASYQCRVETFSYFTEYEDATAVQVQTTYVGGVLLAQQQVTYQRTADDLVRTESTLRHRWANGGVETFFTTKQRLFIVEQDNSRRLVGAIDDDGLRTALADNVPGTYSEGTLFVGDQNGEHKAYYSTGPLDSSGSTVPGRTLRKVKVNNAAGQLLAHYTQIATAVGTPDTAAFELIDSQSWVYDATGRVVERRGNGGVVLETTTYDDALHTTTTVDASGMTTTIVKDADGNIIARHRDGLPATGDLPAIPAVTETTASTNDTYDRIVTVVQRSTVAASGSPALTQTSTTVRDNVGRTVLTTDAQGISKLYYYSTYAQSTAPGSPLMAVVSSNVVGGSGGESSVSYPDGQIQYRATMDDAEQHNRTISNDGLIIDDISGWKWSRVTSDLSGLILKVEKGAAYVPEGAATSIYSSTFYHDDHGRVIRGERTGLASQLAEYNAFGEAEAAGTDLDGNGTLDRAGSDPLTTRTTSIQQAEGAWWQVNTETRFVENGSDQNTVTRAVWRRLGLPSGSLVKSIESDGRQEIASTTIDRATAISIKVTSTWRNGVKGEESIITSRGGLLMKEERTGLPGAITHDYDGLGRRIATHHPLTGTQTWTYNASHQLQSTADGFGKTTSFTYNADGEIATRTNADQSTTSYDYNVTIGGWRTVWETGTAGYLVGRQDGGGLPIALWTKRGDGASSDPYANVDYTYWYHDSGGRLTSKQDAAGKVTTYTYGPHGLLATRTSARGVITSYAYDGDGRVVGVSYSDGTPSTTTSYDRLGRAVSITDASGTRSISYDCPCPSFSAASYAGDSLLPNMKVSFTHDDAHRRNAMLIQQGEITLATTDYTYVGTTMRLQSVALDGATATYDWTTQVGDLPGTVTYIGSGLTGTRVSDAAGRLDSITWTVNNQVVSSTDYTLDVMGRRTAAEREDGTAWAYDYNSKGEVIGASHSGTDGPLPGRSFGYAYDGIGNRTAATVATVNPPPAFTETTYATNNLNQYTTVQHPNPLRKVVQGLAHEQADIEITMATQSPSSNNPSSTNPSALTVARLNPSGQGFIAEPQVDTSTGPAWRFIEVKATRPGVGVNGQAVTTKRTGWLYFPPQTEALSYDDDGNLTEDARWQYTWDAENRLIGMEERSGDWQSSSRPPLLKLTFTYDSQSRRIRKVVEQGSTGVSPVEWSVTSDSRFLYDDWNLIAEFTMNQESGVMNLKSSFAWGYDLSGTQQGAGGVGGLLMVKSHSPTASLSTIAPTYDGNGNITAYVNMGTGIVTQRLEYDAFGNELGLESTLTGTGVASAAPFRFSTKYTDSETSLVYYGFRYYSPEHGRWTAKDPIGERGGPNLLGMVGNDTTNKIDVNGLATCSSSNDEGNTRRNGCEVTSTNGLSPDLDDAGKNIASQAGQAIGGQIGGALAPLFMDAVGLACQSALLKTSSQTFWVKPRTQTCKCYNVFGYKFGCAWEDDSNAWIQVGTVYTGVDGKTDLDAINALIAATCKDY